MELVDDGGSSSNFRWLNWFRCFLYAQHLLVSIQIQISGSSAQPYPQQSRSTEVCIELVVFVRTGLDQLKAL